MAADRLLKNDSVVLALQHAICSGASGLSYARDPRAELDVEFFGWVTPPRDERLEEVSGPPEGKGETE